MTSGAESDEHTGFHLMGKVGGDTAHITSN